jgi:hypothetical protein
VSDQADLPTLPEWLITAEIRRRYGLNRVQVSCWADAVPGLARREPWRQGWAGFRLLINTIVLGGIARPT